MTDLPFLPRSPLAWDPAASAYLPKKGWHPRLPPPAPQLLLRAWACALVRGSEPRPETERACPSPLHPRRPSPCAVSTATSRRAVPALVSICLIAPRVGLGGHEGGIGTRQRRPGPGLSMKSRRDRLHIPALTLE